MAAGPPHPPPDLQPGSEPVGPGLLQMVLCVNSSYLPLQGDEDLHKSGHGLHVIQDELNFCSLSETSGS